MREWNVYYKKLGQLPDREDIIEPRLIHASSLLVKISCPSAALLFIGRIQVFSYLLCLDFILHQPLQQKSSLRSVAGKTFPLCQVYFYSDSNNRKQELSHILTALQHIYLTWAIAKATTPSSRLQNSSSNHLC